jgi:hypothetical protein
LSWMGCVSYSNIGAQARGRRTISRINFETSGCWFGLILVSLDAVSTVDCIDINDWLGNRLLWPLDPMKVINVLVKIVFCATYDLRPITCHTLRPSMDSSGPVARSCAFYRPIQSQWSQFRQHSEISRIFLSCGNWSIECIGEAHI